MNPSKPEGYEADLGEYGTQLYDSDCGEPVGWGFKILHYLGDERFNMLHKFGNLECSYPSWFLITKKLTREEAIKKYGKITNEEFGSRGGWKSVTFGKKQFCSRDLAKNE